MPTIFWLVAVLANLFDLVAVFIGAADPDEALEEMEGELRVESEEELRVSLEGACRTVPEMDIQGMRMEEMEEFQREEAEKVV